MMFWLGVLHDQPVRGRLAGEGDLGDPAAGGQRLAGLDPEPVDDVEDARRQQVGDELDDLEDRPGRLLGGLEDHRVAGGEGRASFQVAMRIGKFHGMIWPTTPSGSWKW